MINYQTVEMHVLYQYSSRVINQKPSQLNIKATPTLKIVKQIMLALGFVHMSMLLHQKWAKEQSEPSSTPRKLDVLL